MNKILIIMEKRFLLPNRFKLVGWLILLISLSLWIYSVFIIKGEIPFLKTSTFSIISSEFLKETEYFAVIQTNLTYTLTGILFIIGGLFVAFSREKVEDEFISKLRLVSFQWSFLINHILLLFLFIFVYGMDFMNVLIYNMFTTLILFIIHFHYLMYKYKNIGYEK
jgi:hypothetical protein